ncbi:hypothetical protein PMAYCL1PPCAC_19490, partial [Pristionchus mayeri]
NFRFATMAFKIDSKQIIQIDGINNHLTFFQTDDGTIFYYDKFRDKLYVKHEGEIHQKDLPNVVGIRAHGDAVFFTDRAKIYKAVFSPTGGIKISLFRDVQLGEELCSFAMFKRTRNGKTYRYRICDRQAIHVNASEGVVDDLDKAELRSVHRGKLIYLSKFCDMPRPSIYKLDDFAIVIRAAYDDAFIRAIDSLPFIYLSLNDDIVHILDTKTMEFLRPLQFPLLRIESIAGVHNGAMTVEAWLLDEKFIVTARVPDRVSKTDQTSESVSDAKSTVRKQPETVKPVPQQQQPKPQQPTPQPTPQQQHSTEEPITVRKNPDYRQSVNEDPTLKLAGSMASLNMVNQKVEGTGNFSSKFLNEFNVLEVLGKGGFGCVFQAIHKDDNCEYAVKRIAVESKKLDKAMNEARIMAQLYHENIVRYNCTWIEKPPEGWQHDTDTQLIKAMYPTTDMRRITNFDDDSAFIYIQMQLCNHSLSEWLTTHDKPADRNILKMRRWFIQIVSAVNYIHGKNLIHRDLKPSNILFAEKETIKLCDLGIATQRNSEETYNTMFSRTSIGTPLYMSPEQKKREQYSSKTDVFTLGLILAELCVVMTTKSREEIFENFRNGKQCTFLEDQRAAKFIAKLTQVSPSERPTCKEMLDDIFLA